MLTPELPAGFADQVIAWQAVHGRNTLPWQNTRDPYRVWLSEIMLQQTQVVTVLGYYTRFLDQFPTVIALAQASLDTVLGLWSGLGYYSRARNLHRCAQDIVGLYGGEFPQSAQQLQALPGIGRSTAAAIASFCFGERVAILDANVKRVLARVLAVSADLSQLANEKALWHQATALLPTQNLQHAMPRYTQGLMDLGATVCTSRQPQCMLCPVQGTCRAFLTAAPEQYPVKSRKLVRSSQAWSVLWAEKPDRSVWLEQRPASGIWGGLYCLPLFATDRDLMANLSAGVVGSAHWLPTFVHVLTHKDLHLSPCHVKFPAEQGRLEIAVPDVLPAGWFSPSSWPKMGLPAPIRKLLMQAVPA